MKFDCKSIFFALALLVFCLPEKTGAQNLSEDDGFRQLFNEGQAAKAEGRFSVATADFERLEKMDSTIAEVHATLGVLYYQQGNYPRAIVEIQDARKLKPSLPGLDSLLAFSLAESGREQDALRGLERAFRSPTDSQIKRQAGLELMRAYSHLDMDRNASETALQMRDLYGNDPEVLYNVGKILGNSAYITMQTLFHDAGGSPWAYLAEAEALESQGQTDQAIESYRRVLEIEPRHPNIHYQIGRTYLARWGITHAASDLSSAADQFRMELDANPSNANAAYELAGLRRQNGEFAEAEHLYESAIQFYPDFEEAQVGLGAVLLEEQKPSEAIAHLEQATKLRPEDQVAWYRLARAEGAIRQNAAAAESMAEFRRLHAKDQFGTHRVNSPEGITPQKIDADANSQSNPQ
jgi:tetratricopeptide (TPR) repeat protein